MGTQHDLVIRGGTIYDGNGGDAFTGDIAIDNGLITAVGQVDGTGREELNADGLVVSPGWVDIHTHYDGQATWDSRLTPSSEHGVTTVVMGNCGVGFAPVRNTDHDMLINLMEGVEDIPNPVLTEGLNWNWESFGDFLDALEETPKDIDYACQVPHGALRVYVMGERGADREPATEDDVAEMARLAKEAVEAGALGFSTSRTLNHRTASGDPTPTYKAAEHELITIAQAVAEAGAGVLQVVSDFTEPAREFALLHEMMAKSGRPMILSMAQTHGAPDGWKAMLDWVAQENKLGNNLKGMVCGRPVGIMLGLNATMNPFSRNAEYLKIADLPLAERVAKMKDPETRAAILACANDDASNPFNATIANYDAMFVLGDPPNYEQPAEATFKARADEAGVTPEELAYDALLENDGHTLLYTPFLNYANFNLDPQLTMMQHDNTVLGLGDGGAHVGMICDGSFPTSMLTHWTRDRTRGDQLDLAWVVKAQTKDTAEAYGLFDRGVIAPGYKADINLIDHAGLRLHHPTIENDLPAGGKRLVQKADGYVATIVSGTIIQQNGQPTGALPGKLVRGEKDAPAQQVA